jgi:hypothetical protein
VGVSQVSEKHRIPQAQVEEGISGQQEGYGPNGKKEGEPNRRTDSRGQSNVKAISRSDSRTAFQKAKDVFKANSQHPRSNSGSQGPHAFNILGSKKHDNGPPTPAKDDIEDFLRGGHTPTSETAPVYEPEAVATRDRCTTEPFQPSRGHPPRSSSLSKNRVTPVSENEPAPIIAPKPLPTFEEPVAQVIPRKPVPAAAEASATPSNTGLAPSGWGYLSDSPAPKPPEKPVPPTPRPSVAEPVPLDSQHPLQQNPPELQQPTPQSVQSVPLLLEQNLPVVEEQTPPAPLPKDDEPEPEPQRLPPQPIQPVQPIQTVRTVETVQISQPIQTPNPQSTQQVARAPIPKDNDTKRRGSAQEAARVRAMLENAKIEREEANAEAAKWKLLLESFLENVRKSEKMYDVFLEVQRVEAAIKP